MDCRSDAALNPVPQSDCRYSHGKMIDVDVETTAIWSDCVSDDEDRHEVRRIIVSRVGGKGSRSMWPDALCASEREWGEGRGRERRERRG